MAQTHGRNAKIYVWDSSGTCRDISGDLNQITLSWSRSNDEVTTLGDDSLQRISGLRDVGLSGAGIWNGAANAVEDTLDDLMSGSVISLIKYDPAGTITGCTRWTGCFLLSSYEINNPLDGPVAISYEFQLASGSLSASTV